MTTDLLSQEKNINVVVSYIIFNSFSSSSASLNPSQNFMKQLWSLCFPFSGLSLSVYFHKWLTHNMTKLWPCDSLSVRKPFLIRPELRQIKLNMKTDRRTGGGGGGRGWNEEGNDDTAFSSAGEWLQESYSSSHGSPNSVNKIRVIYPTTRRPNSTAGL